MKAGGDVVASLPATMMRKTNATHTKSGEEKPMNVSAVKTIAITLPTSEYPLPLFLYQ